MGNIMMFSYLICYQGGIGPDVWDAEIIVEAEGIHVALHKAEERLKDVKCQIVSVEQEE